MLTVLVMTVELVFVNDGMMPGQLSHVVVNNSCIHFTTVVHFTLTQEQWVLIIIIITIIK